MEMIQRIMETIFWLMFALKLFGSLTYVASKPQTVILTGGYDGSTTGARLTHNMTNTTHPAESIHILPQSIVPATIIERGETLTNGCYKQIVKEPDYSDVKRFISTEQLICPPNVNITTLPQQYQKPLNPPYLMPMLTTQPVVGLVQPNFTGHPVAPPQPNVYRTPAVLPVPVNGTSIAVLPPPSFPSAPLPPVLTQQKYQPDVFLPKQPVMAEIPNTATSQVIVLSQQTGYYDAKKKTNSANTTLLTVTGNVILVVVAIFTCFM